MLEYSPFSDEAKADPYAIYAKLRAEAPAYYLEKFDAWALSTFEDVWAASMDTEHYTALAGTTGDQLLSKTFPVVPMLNVLDPPDHTQIRSLLRPFFGPGRMRKMTDRVQAAVDVNLLISLVRRFFAREDDHEGMTQDGTAAFQEMGAYLVDLVASRRKRPTYDDDPLNTLLSLDLDGRRMVDEEIGTHLLLLLLGGFETLP